MKGLKLRNYIKQLEREAKAVNLEETKSLIKYYKKNKKFKDGTQFHINMLKKIIKGEI